MSSWEDVAAIALALPEVAESTSYGERDWKVRKKTFAWAELEEAVVDAWLSRAPKRVAAAYLEERGGG
jgi:hypothetical protein